MRTSENWPSDFIFQGRMMNRFSESEKELKNNFTSTVRAKSNTLTQKHCSDPEEFFKTSVKISSR